MNAQNGNNRMGEVLLDQESAPRSSTLTDIDPHLRTQDDFSTRILFKAKYADSMVDSCDTEVTRKYFYVLENGYELNRPYWTILSFNAILVCLCLPPCCCGEFEVCSNSVFPGFDHIKRVYFDRGEFDERNCIRVLGLVSGRPRTIPSGMKCVLCCMDVPESLIEWWYGEQISVVSYDTCCFVVPNRASYLTNFGNLCGPRIGEPFCIANLTYGLAKGEGARGTDALDTARKEWQERVEKIQR